MAAPRALNFPTERGGAVVTLQSVAACIVVVVCSLTAGCVGSPRICGGIVKQTCCLGAGRERIDVDFYFRPGAGLRPLAVVSHGFLANRARMAHWGVTLAREGFVVAAPSHPTLADTRRNVNTIRGLVGLAREGRLPIDAKTDGRAALIGFSRGGMEALVAASSCGGVRAWVGLDPVDHRGEGAAVAPRVHVPGLALLADPSVLNDNGNARRMLADYAGPLRVVAIRGASHLDAESPRSGVFTEFRRETVEFLRSVLRSTGDGSLAH